LCGRASVADGARNLAPVDREEGVGREKKQGER
jgi:hypothetical protein